METPDSTSPARKRKRLQESANGNEQINGKVKKYTESTHESLSSNDHPPQYEDQHQHHHRTRDSKVKQRRRESVSEAILSEIPLRKSTPESAVLGSSKLSQCFYRVTTNMYLSIAPMYSLSPIAGIRAQHLDPLIMTYYPAVGGVVLSCLDVRIDTQAGARVVSESPFAFAWIEADFLVWRPKRGDILQGQINLQSHTHVGLLVCDVFNASITREKLPPKWKFIETQLAEDEQQSLDDQGSLEISDSQQNGDYHDPDDAAGSLFDQQSLGYWIDENGMKIGQSKLEFVVESLQSSGKLVSLEGSLLKLGHVATDLTAPHDES
ncbi:uncharacterized protein V1516DRAFT_680650 [Lipomyces oligophaga]|uniref:uncharacterized protein n=1 Tax=Lipomyces oligophaga TaxID=45792 RepID=UPI0034CDD450